MSLSSRLNDANDRLSETCHARQAARTAIRSVLTDDPDTDVDEIVLLDLNLPVQVTC